MTKKSKATATPASILDATGAVDPEKARQEIIKSMAEMQAVAVEPLPNEPRAIVSVRFLDGGDVEVTVNGQILSFDDGIILRWGRKRG